MQGLDKRQQEPEHLSTHKSHCVLHCRYVMVNSRRSALSVAHQVQIPKHDADGFQLQAYCKSILKVHYATFLRAVNKQRDRALDARNSSLQELT